MEVRLDDTLFESGSPVWSKLPEPQRWQLVSFIKSLGASPTSLDKKITLKTWLGAANPMAHGH
jgi:hypothetical protein